MSDPNTWMALAMVGAINLFLYYKRGEMIWLGFLFAEVALALIAACVEHYLMYHYGN